MAKSNLQVPVHPESFQDLEFPSRGIDLSQEISSQIPGTTPLGQNVRWNEPLTQNARGGSRSGLSKYIPDFVNTTGASKIQNLDSVVIVDSSAVATGGGFQPVTHTTRTHTPFWRNRGGHILGVQKKMAYFNQIGPVSFSLDDPVTAGHDLVICVCFFENHGGGTGGNLVKITGLRGSYSQIDFCPIGQVFMWRGKVSSTGLETLSVDLTPTSPEFGTNQTWCVGALEYSGMNATPLDGHNTTDDPSTIYHSSDPLTPGPVNVGVANERIVMCVVNGGDTGLYTASGSLTLELAISVSGPETNSALAVFDGTYSTSTSPTVTCTADTLNFSIGASFKPA